MKNIIKLLSVAVIATVLSVAYAAPSEAAQVDCKTLRNKDGKIKCADVHVDADGNLQAGAPTAANKGKAFSGAQTGKCKGGKSGKERTLICGTSGNAVAADVDFCYQGDDGEEEEDGIEPNPNCSDAAMDAVSAVRIESSYPSKGK